MEQTDKKIDKQAERKNYQEWYAWGVDGLEKAGIAEAKLDARLLLEACCNTEYNTLLAHGDRILSPEEQKSYVNYIEKRAKHIPLQHLTGTQEFMGLDFLVNDKVLIPRQDTEVLVEEVLRHLHDGMRILDLCTGSGCILLSLLHYSNGCKGVGVDISEAALQVAKENAQRILEKQGVRKTASEETGMAEVQFVQGDLYDGLKDICIKENNIQKSNNVGAKFDIIVSNPPYIRQDVISTLMPEVKEHEPLLALDGGEDGLTFYRRIVEKAAEYLCGGGMLFFEIGAEQGSDVKGMLAEAGFRDVEIIKDLAGLDRVVYGVLY